MVLPALPRAAAGLAVRWAMIKLGRYQDVLAGETFDALICDPPYSERTHRGHAAGVGMSDRLRTNLSYEAWSEPEILELVKWGHERCRGWIALLLDHVEARWAEEALERTGRYVFAPLPFVETGRSVRLCGDGPSSWASWLVVARPRTPPYSTWGTLPGAYIQRGRGGERHIGGKPLGLMRAIVRDYTRPDDFVCDPCAGLGTTLIAARAEGRRGIGAECDPETYGVAVRMWGRPWQPTFAEVTS